MPQQKVEPNLWQDPWIPIRLSVPSSSHPGSVGFGGLLLGAHEIEHVALQPAPAESALLRVLVLLTARVTGLDEARNGRDDWEERQDIALAEGRLDPDRVQAYFEQYADRFSLHGDRPWMQDPRLRSECDKAAGVNKLQVSRSAGQNHAWFGHHQDAQAQPASVTDAVASMLVWLYYGASGKCSSRRIGNGKVSNALAGPLRSSLSYFPLGPNLFTTLLASIPYPKDARKKVDLCPWEWAELPDPAAVPQHRDGMCATLTAGAQHAVLLNGDGHGRIDNAWITVATPHRVPVDADPYVIYQVSKAGNTYQRPADAGRALWRDLDALLLKKPTGSSQPRRPFVFTTAEAAKAGLRVRALGFQQDGQAKDEQFVTGTTPPVLDLLEHENDGAAAIRVGDLRVAGEAIGNRLDRAVKTAWANLTNGDLGDCAWAKDAGAIYWPAAESEFWRRLNARDFDNPRASFLRIAEDTFDHVTDQLGASGRGIKAVERARIWLYGGPSKKTKTKGAAKKTEAGT